MSELRKRLRSDAIAGIFITILGLFAVTVASQYQIGTLGRMGPGMFPLMIGVSLVLVGLGIALSGRASQPARDAAESLYGSLPVVGPISISVLLFVWTYDYLGLIPAIFVLVGVASSVQRPFSTRRTFMTALVVSGFCYVVFVQVFAIPLSSFRWGF